MENKFAIKTTAYKKMLDSWLNGRLFHANLIIGADTILSGYIAKNISREILKQGTTDEANVSHKVQKGVHPDLFEVGKDKPIDVKDAKDIIEKVQVSPYEGTNKVFIIYNFDQCGPSPMNKLLKTLEEPPSGTYFFLIVENENRLLQTILSRTQKFYTSPLTDKDIEEYIKLKTSSEEAINIASMAGGSLTRAVNLSLNGSAGKVYDFVMDTYLNYNKTSQFGHYSKKMEGVKEHLATILDIFQSLASKAMRLRIGKNSITKDITNVTDAGRIASTWPFPALVYVIEAAVKAQEMLSKKTTEQNVIDQFLFRILEVKIKCRR